MCILIDFQVVALAITINVILLCWYFICLLVRHIRRCLIRFSCGGCMPMNIDRHCHCWRWCFRWPCWCFNRRCINSTCSCTWWIWSALYSPDSCFFITYAMCGMAAWRMNRCVNSIWVQCKIFEWFSVCDGIWLGCHHSSRVIYHLMASIGRKSTKKPAKICNIFQTIAVTRWIHRKKGKNLWNETISHQFDFNA